MPKSSKSKKRKAQFFLLTGFVIVSMFFLISKWIAPYNILDSSELAMNEEILVFNNIKEGALKIVETSHSCEELAENLELYKEYISDYTFRKLIVFFDYSIETPCYKKDPDFPVLVIFDIELKSSTISIRDKFYGYWPPGSGP